MMTVNEFSRRSDVAAHVVRYYTRIGLLEPARDPGNGYKLFSSADAARLRFIRNAQHLGYSLDEIRGFLALSGRGKPICREVRAVLRRRLDENRAKLDELMALQQRMQHALQLWETLPDTGPEEGRVCHLIDAATTLDA